MSQEKVDRYKEEKKNRQKLIKKQKIQSAMYKTAGVLVAAVLVGWIGYSVYDGITSSQAAESKTYSVDTTAVDEYLNEMSAAASETESEEGAEVETELTGESQAETDTEAGTDAETQAETATEAVTE